MPDKTLSHAIISAVNAAPTSGAYTPDAATTPVRSVDDVRWRQVGPGESGTCQFLGAHPTEPALVFMSNDMGSSYRSSDGGRSWQSIIDADGDGLVGSQMEAIAFARSAPDIGYAATRTGLIRSTDRGRSWQRVGGPFGSGHVNTVAVLDEQADTVIAGTGCRSIRVATGRRINPGIILRSTDGGNAWTPFAEGIAEDALIEKLAASPGPAANARLFAATSNGFYVRDVGDDRWRRADASLVHGNCADLAVSQTADGHCVLTLVLWTEVIDTEHGRGVSGGIYRSDDLGESWRDISSNLWFSPDELAGGQHHFLRRYLRLGRTGEPDCADDDLQVAPLQVLQRFNHVAVHPADPNRIWLGVAAWWRRLQSFDPTGVWQTTDGGGSWQMCTRRGRGWDERKDYWHERGQPTSNNVDCGFYSAKFSSQAAYTLIDTRGMCLSAADPQRLYFSSRHVVYGSQDGGNSWTSLDSDPRGAERWAGRGNSNVCAASVAIDPRRPDQVFLTGSDISLMQTDAAGTSFALTNVDTMVVGDVESITFDPDDPAIIYAPKTRGDPGKLFRSDDGGRAFHQLSHPVDIPLRQDPFVNRAAPIHTVLVDPASSPAARRLWLCSSSMQRNRQELLPAFNGVGILCSEDGGITWQPANTGIGTNLNVSRLAMAPDRTRYASVFGWQPKEDAPIHYGGLFSQAPDATVWARLPLPDVVLSVVDVDVNPTSPQILHVACGGAHTAFADAPRCGGVWRSEDGGATWKAVFHAQFCNCVTTDPGDPNTIYLAAANSFARRFTGCPGIYRSRDGGVSWDRINTGLATPTRVNHILCHPGRPGRLWCATVNSGWYVTARQ
jgi:photosystem II stability/assembly factor-like uncharacterized protein